MKSQNCFNKIIPYIAGILLSTGCSDVIAANKSNINQITSLNFSEKKINTNTIKMSDIQKSPLKIMNNKYKNLKNLLGMNQFEYIMNVYNADIIKYKNKLIKINGKQEQLNLINDSIKEYDSINFPNIYDPIKSYFPDLLENFKIKYPEFKNDINEEKNCFIVTKTPINKYVLLYYKNGKLFIATHISPGKGNTTKNGKFKIKFNNNNYYKFKRSKKYDNTPIPYSIPIHDGIFLHVGIEPDGTKKSHGCIRVPWLYQQKIFNDLKNGQEINIIIKI